VSQKKTDYKYPTKRIIYLTNWDLRLDFLVDVKCQIAGGKLFDHFMFTDCLTYELQEALNKTRVTVNHSIAVGPHAK